MRWRILTDDHLPGPGGVSTWTDAIVRGLREAGDEVRVFARARPGLPEGVTGVICPSFSRRGHWALALRSAGSWADRTLATTWAVAPPLAQGLIVAGHGSDLTRPAPPRRQRVLARSVVGVMSEHLAARARALGALPVLWPAPVDASPRPRSPGSGDRWLWCGRAVPGKGGERFLRMVAAGQARGTVLGDGPELAAWRALAAALGADVRFHGAVPSAQVRRIMAEHDLLILAPEGPEGLGLVLLEAAGEGVWTVGCRSGGVPEAVGPGLLLDDPDDAHRSAAQIRGAWRPDAGAASWAWLRATHGRDKAVAALRAAPDRP